MPGLELAAYIVTVILIIVLILTRLAMDLNIIADGAVYHVDYVDWEHVRLTKVKE